MSFRTGSGSHANGMDARAPTRGASQVSSDCRELLTSSKLTELLEEVAPGEILDADVEQFLQEHVDEFVDSVTESACRIAKHRKSRTVEARDFQVHLQTKWNIRVPGYGDDPRPPTKRNHSSPVHNARLQAIAKTQQQQTNLQHNQMQQMQQGNNQPQFPLQPQPQNNNIN